MIDVTVFLEPRYHPQVGVFHSTVELRALGCGRNDHLSILCVSEDAAEALMLSRGQAPFASWKGRQVLSFACGRR